MSTYAQQIEFLIAENAAAALGTATVYLAGTTTPATIYSARDKGTTAANPFTLDARGTAQLYADGIIKVVVKNSTGSTLYTRDNLAYGLQNGPWVDVSSYATLNAAITAIGSTQTSLLINTATTLNASATVPSTLTLLFGGAGSIDQGVYTLTINSPFTAPFRQVFTGTGAVTLNKTVEAYPEWWTSNANPGTTDTTTAISAALNCGAKSVRCDGTYATTNEIVGLSSVHLHGNGTITASTLGANKSIIKFTANDVTVSGLTLAGPSTSAYVAEENGLYFYGTNGAERSSATIRNVKIYNLGSFGICAEYYNNVTVEDCYIHDVGYAGVCGLSSDGLQVVDNRISTITPGTSSNAYGITVTNRANEDVSNAFNISNNHIDGVTVWEAIDTHAGSLGVISNNTITSCLVGIVVTYDTSSTTPTPPSSIVISNNVITNGSVSTPGRGIVISGYDASNKASNIVVIGNKITGMGGTTTYEGAIDISYTDANTISSNSVINSTSHGVNLYQTNTSITVSGNSVIGVGVIANAAGIQVYSANHTGSISGNHLSVSTNYGISSLQPNSGMLLNGNNIVSSNSTPIYTIASFGSGGIAKATSTTDVGNLTAGASAYFSVTVTGAVTGDIVTVSSNSEIINQNLIVTGQVGSTNTVYVRVMNPTAGAIDPPSATYTIVVMKP